MTPKETRIIEIQGFFQRALSVFEKSGLSEHEGFAQALILTQKTYSKEVLYKSAFEYFEQQLVELINQVKK